MSGLRKGYLHLALESLRASRTRSFMTMLGIVIGVMSVVVIAAIGQGVKEQIGNQAAKYGKDVLLVRPNTSSNGLTGSGLPGGTSTLLSPPDLDRVRGVDGVSLAVPLSAVKGSVKADYTVEDPLVIATTPELSSVLNQKIEYGGFFTAADGGNVAVLGSDIAKKLFSDMAPLGQKITFRGHQFMVSGVFKPFMAAPFSLEANYNQAVFLPYSTVQNLLGSAPQINQIFAKAKPNAKPTTLAQSIERTLTEAHGGTSDMMVLPPGARGVGSDHTLDLLTYMTIGMATVALIVGGVGIMNMMLVSVTERIHEIGLRKAIGATNKQILRQFMTEAFALCVVGSIIGLVGSFAVVALLKLYTSLQPVIVWQVAVIAPLVALTIGVFFGAIPALKAARMDPIEALRHE